MSVGRCVFWSQGPLSEVYRVRTSTCRALAVASMRKCVRTSLAGTKDCLYNLLVILTPFEKGISIVCYFILQLYYIYKYTFHIFITPFFCRY